MKMTIKAAGTFPAAFIVILLQSARPISLEIDREPNTSPYQYKFNSFTNFFAIRYTGVSIVRSTSFKYWRMGKCWGQCSSHFPQPTHWETLLVFERSAVF